ncbi:MAG: endonuclease III [Nitrospirales bacterium]|nr:endonuclease III [Nitrospirales bacterium]
MSARPKTPDREEPLEAKKRRVREIIHILDHFYPDTRLALNFSNPLELLIALILAAQCTDDLVNKVTAKLFNKYRTPQKWVDLDRNALEQEIRPITFFRNKSKAIQACCLELNNRFDGQVPDSLEDLLTLPGVGRKTANILRGNAFGQAAIGVDRHVGRLSQVMGLTKETNPDKIEFDLNPLVPDAKKVRFCHLLQKHGRSICLARKPACSECPINDLCPFPSKATTKQQKVR